MGVRCSGTATRCTGSHAAQRVDQCTVGPARAHFRLSSFAIWDQFDDGGPDQAAHTHFYVRPHAI